MVDNKAVVKFITIGLFGEKFGLERKTAAPERGCDD